MLGFTTVICMSIASAGILVENLIRNNQKNEVMKIIHDEKLDCEITPELIETKNQVLVFYQNGDKRFAINLSIATNKQKVVTQKKEPPPILFLDRFKGEKK